jgi:hypothetical protein
MTCLKQGGKELIGSVESAILAPQVIIGPDNATLDDVHIQPTASQKAYLKQLAITSDPMDLDFYNHVQQIPSLDTVFDTQDTLRAFAGGGRTAYGGMHMAATWTLGPTLSKQSIEILAEISKYITLGPDAIEDPVAGVGFAVEFGSDTAYVVSDNPAHLLASYFIRDFKSFDIFKTKPPSSAKIIGSFMQPNGNGTIRFT